MIYWLIKDSPRIHRRWSIYRELTDKEFEEIDPKHLLSRVSGLSPIKLVMANTFKFKQASIKWVDRNNMGDATRFTEEEIPLMIHECPEACEKLLMKG